MSFSSLILTGIAIFVIFGGAQQLILCRNLSIYNFILTGLVISFIFALIYQNFSFVFNLLIQSNSFLNRVFIQNPRLLISLITNTTLFFLLIFIFIFFRLSWLSSKFDRLDKGHLYQKAAEVAEERLKFLYRFCGDHYLTGCALGALAVFYGTLGRREETKRLFVEAFDVFSKSSYFNSQDKSALEVRIKISLRLAEFYLLELDLNEAEAYCQKVLNLKSNKKISGIFLCQACQLMGLIQLHKGNYNNFVVESAKAKKIYQKWIENEQKFQNIRDKLKSSDVWFVRIVPSFVIAAVCLPAIIFRFLRTKEYVIFMMIVFATLWLIDSLVNQFIKQNNEKQEAILKYYTLVQEEGKYYENLGDYELAEEKYNEVFDRLSALHENSVSKELVRAKNLQNQAKLQVLKGNDEAAISNYDNAVRIYELINNYSGSNFVHQECRDNQINCLLNRYLIYAKLVGIQVAEVEIYRAFVNVENLLVYPSHYNEYADALILLGMLYCFYGMYSNAGEKYFKAEQILLQSSSLNFYGKGFLDFAKSYLYVATGRLREALESIRRSNKMFKILLLQSLSVASEKHRMYALQNNDIYFNCYATILCKYFSNYASEVGELFDSVLQHKAIGAEVLATQRDILSEDRYPPQKLKELQDKLDKLTKKRREIAHKTLEAIAPSNVADLQTLNREREILEEELAREIPELNLEKTLKAVDRTIVSQALPPGSALIEIVLVNFVEFNAAAYQAQSELSNSSYYLAFVLHTAEQNNIQMIYLGEAELVNQMIAAFRHSITEEYKTRHFRTPQQTPTKDSNIGVNLRIQVFDSLLKAIGNCKRLFIAPDGDLSRLPFEVLPTDDGNRLIDVYSISYLSAGRDLLRFGFHSNHQVTQSIVIADPDFDYGFSKTFPSTLNWTEFSFKQSRNLDLEKFNFERLSGIREEGEQIASMLGVEAWLEEKALKQKLLESVSSPKILHIATHGFFLEDQQQNSAQDQFLNTRVQFSSSNLENPLLRSGLALAGANWKSKNFIPPSETDNGILTAEEVTGMNLSATELVVLSACETGLGEVRRSEGVFGLRRAFVLAGAKTLVMSLWKVPDQQTKELMIDFYNRILKGESRSEALKNAQLEMRKKYSDPYYWGAFICQGNPDPL